MNISRLSRAIGLALQTMPYYAVRSGRSVGVYHSWDDCKSQVNGYQGARYKKFGTPEEAWGFMNAESDPNPYFWHNSQPARQPQTWKTSSSFSYSKRAATSQYYEPASFASDYSPPTVYTSKRKYEATVETDSFHSYPAKKTRSYSTGSSSSYGSSSSISSSSSSGSASGSGRAVVYTDGSCESNGRRGARAGVGVYWGDNNPYNTSERLEGRQTNQRAEITAAIRALETAKSRNLKEVTLYTDSKYTMNAITDWMPRWKQNGWKTVGKKDVQNKMELQTLDHLCQDVNVDWKYVPGHSNVKGNEAADSLARAGARMPAH